MDKLDSILDERKIRMYNLNKSDDPLEYNYVFDKIRNAYNILFI